MKNYYILKKFNLRFFANLPNCQFQGSSQSNNNQRFLIDKNLHNKLRNKLMQRDIR